VSEAEENDQDEQKKPSGVVKDSNKGHDGNGDEKDRSTPSSKERIGDVASVQLANRKEIEGGDEKTNPPGIPNGVKDHIIIFRNLTYNQTLNEREEERISEADCPLFKMGCGNHLRKS
jgi:hypothetical protein